MQSTGPQPQVMNGWPDDGLTNRKRLIRELLSMSIHGLVATDMNRSLTKVRDRIVSSFLAEKMVLSKVTYSATLGTQPFQYLGSRQQTTYHSVCSNLKAVGTGSYQHECEFAEDHSIRDMMG